MKCETKVKQKVLLLQSMEKKIPVAPLNIVFVKITKKLYDTIRFASGVTLYKNTSFHPEEASMCEATVVSLPRAVQDRFDYAGMSTFPMSPGDTILIRYDVVFHYALQPDRDSPVWKNILLWEGEEYWRVDIQQVFGILRKGYVEMLNGYIMCDPCSVHVDFGSFASPTGFVVKQSNELYKVRYLGDPLPHDPNLQLHPGDHVHIRPGLAQNYETDWGDFSIIKQSHVLAREGNIA